MIQTCYFLKYHFHSYHNPLLLKQQRHWNDFHHRKYKNSMIWRPHSHLCKRMTTSMLFTINAFNYNHNFQSAIHYFLDDVVQTQSHLIVTEWLNVTCLIVTSYCVIIKYIYIMYSKCNCIQHSFFGVFYLLAKTQALSGSPSVTCKPVPCMQGQF